MIEDKVGRRMLLAGAGVGLAALASPAQAATGLNTANEAAIRAYYKAWETRDWQPIDALLADDFTFTSANDDDHISKAAFKTQCWETQIDHIQRFDLLHVSGSGDEAFVMYVCLTKNGKSFRNVEFIRLRNSRLAAIECYFGAQSSFASAVSTGK